MKLKKIIRKTIAALTPSPIKLDFQTGGGSAIKEVADYPEIVNWDDSVPIHKTDSGIEYVTTPEERFKTITDLPYKNNYINIDGLKMHYLDVGPVDGEIILMLHGQPTWCYLYRKMIKELVQKNYRCIAPDMIGMGRSDKPIREKYHTYDRHCDNMNLFIEKLGLKNITVFVQDWGSLIGLRLVGEKPDLFSRVIVANGDLPEFTKENNPFYIPEKVVINPKIKGLKSALAKHSLRGMPDGFQAWIMYCLTTPQFKASETIDFATSKKLSNEVLAAYNAPFPSFIYCAAPRTLASMLVGIRGQTLNAWEGLRNYDKPFLSLIGLDDHLLGRSSIQNKFKNAVPGAKGQDHEQFENANHFIQEDIGEIMADEVNRFIENNPL